MDLAGLGPLVGRLPRVGTSELGEGGAYAERRRTPARRDRPGGGCATAPSCSRRARVAHLDPGAQAELRARSAPGWPDKPSWCGPPSRARWSGVDDVVVRLDARAPSGRPDAPHGGSGPGSAAPGTRRRCAACGFGPPPWRRLAGALRARRLAASGATSGCWPGSGPSSTGRPGGPGSGHRAGCSPSSRSSPSPAPRSATASASSPTTPASGRCPVAGLALRPPGATVPRRALGAGAPATWPAGPSPTSTSLQDLYLRGLGPLVVAVVVGAAAICVGGPRHRSAAAILAGAASSRGDRRCARPSPRPAGRPKRIGPRRAAGRWPPTSSTCVRARPSWWPSDAPTRTSAIEARAGRIVQRPRRPPGGRGPTGPRGPVGAAAVRAPWPTAERGGPGGQLEPIMLAVLPLTALGAFEVVPVAATAAAGPRRGPWRPAGGCSSWPTPRRRSATPPSPVAARSRRSGSRVAGARLRYGAGRAVGARRARSQAPRRVGDGAGRGPSGRARPAFSRAAAVPGARCGDAWPPERRRSTDGPGDVRGLTSRRSTTTPTSSPGPCRDKCLRPARRDGREMSARAARRPGSPSG